MRGLCSVLLASLPFLGLAFVLPAAPEVSRRGTVVAYARRQYEKVSRPDFLAKSLLIAGVSVPLLKFRQEQSSGVLEASNFDRAASLEVGAPFAFSKPRSVALSELREVVKHYQDGGLRVRQPTPGVVQVGFRGQEEAAVEFVVGEREMRARPLSGGLTGDCNGVRMINGLSEQLAGRPGWRTFGYPLVCPEAR